MPGLNGTGPAGMGPMTGRGQGYCNPSGTTYGSAQAGRTGYWGPGYGQGFGQGRGFNSGFRPGPGMGRGYGRGFGRRGPYPPAGGWYEPAYNGPYGNPYGMRPEDEVNMLKGEADAIKSELDAINKRIEELKTEPAET